MTILEQIPAYTPHGLYIAAMFLVFTVMAVFICCWVEDVFSTGGLNNSRRYTIATVILIILFIVGLILGFNGVFSYRNEKEDKYIVEIDHAMTVNELSEEWEIVSKEKYSDIYTLRKKGLD